MQVAEAVGIDVSEAAWLLGMVTAIGANFALSFIGNVAVRKLYSSLISLCFGLFIGGMGFLIVLLSIVLVWLAMATLPRN